MFTGKTEGREAWIPRELLVPVSGFTGMYLPVFLMGKKKKLQNTPKRFRKESETVPGIQPRGLWLEGVDGHLLGWNDFLLISQISQHRCQIV